LAFWISLARRGYHVAHNLCKRAKASLDGRSKGARQWFASARHRLRHGEVDAVMAAMAAALALDNLPDTAPRRCRISMTTWTRIEITSNTSSSNPWACLLAVA